MTRTHMATTSLTLVGRNSALQERSEEDYGEQESDQDVDDGERPFQSKKQRVSSYTASEIVRRIETLPVNLCCINGDY